MFKYIREIDKGSFIMSVHVVLSGALYKETVQVLSCIQEQAFPNKPDSV